MSAALTVFFSINVKDYTVKFSCEEIKLFYYSLISLSVLLIIYILNRYIIFLFFLFSSRL